MMRQYLLLGTLILSGCSGGIETPRPGPGRATDRPYKITNSFMKDQWFHPQKHLEYDDIGLASWYGPGFHTKKTSTGEVYDQHGLTAAHRTLPLPAIVKVTNLENGKSIIVKVNDRGPFTGDDRILDLTLTAAKQLGFHHKGLAKVQVQTLIPETVAYNERKEFIGEATHLATLSTQNVEHTPHIEPLANKKPLMFAKLPPSKPEPLNQVRLAKASKTKLSKKKQIKKAKS
jgi:rare lipoprotein A (peptidoglycan hydrolase)